MTACVRRWRAGSCPQWTPGPADQLALRGAGAGAIGCSLADLPDSELAWLEADAQRALAPTEISVHKAGRDRRRRPGVRRAATTSRMTPRPEPRPRDVDTERGGGPCRKVYAVTAPAEAGDWPAPRSAHRRASDVGLRTAVHPNSAGFTGLRDFGFRRSPAEDYLRAVARYDQEIGGLGWAAPQDWMCEPIHPCPDRAEHPGTPAADRRELPAPARAVAAALRLVVPDHAGAAGLDGSELPRLRRPPRRRRSRPDRRRVRLGQRRAGHRRRSVCRRPAGQTRAVLAALADPRIPLHSFGISTSGPARQVHLMPARSRRTGGEPWCCRS
jgi:hypothetical protein